MEGKYDEHLLSTIGVDFKFRRVKIGKEEIKLQIWDTAGTSYITEASRPSGPLSALTTTAPMPFCFATTYRTTKVFR